MTNKLAMKPQPHLAGMFPLDTIRSWLLPFSNNSFQQDSSNSLPDRTPNHTYQDGTADMIEPRQHLHLVDKFRLDRLHWRRHHLEDNNVLQDRASIYHSINMSLVSKLRAPFEAERRIIVPFELNGIAMTISS